MSKSAEEIFDYAKAMAERERVLMRVAEAGRQLRLRIGDKEIETEFAPELLSNLPDLTGRFEGTHRNRYYRDRLAANQQIGDALRQENLTLLRKALRDLETFMTTTYGVFLEDMRAQFCEHGERRDRCVRCTGVEYEKTVQQLGGQPNW